MNETGSAADKEKKYDRQLRLWGAQGQAALEHAHILLLGSGPTASETMKNLVLPGIGAFTIVDGQTVTERDLGNNFFVEVDSIGKPRAEEVARLLHELNDFVQEAKSIFKNPIDLISENVDIVKEYTLVIATDIPEDSLVALSKACTVHHVPLVFVQTNGLIGYLRAQVPDHTIVESKPDFPPVDLRLATPFEELKAYSDSINLDSLESDEFAHVPYPVLLLKAAQQWRDNHDNEGPKSEEKDLFRESVLQMARSDQSNFQEAYQHAHLAFKEFTIPEEVLSVLSDEKAQLANLTSSSTPFWWMAHALGRWVAQQGAGKHLPLMGTVPDMHTTTEHYVTLQRLYHGEAQKHAREVQAHLEAALQEKGATLTPSITFETVSHFCKHSLFLARFKYRSIASEYSREKKDDDETERLRDAIPLVDYQTMLPGDGLWYLAWRVAQRFRVAYGRYPGENASPESDVSQLRELANDLLSELGFESDDLPDEYLAEISRFGNAQLHTIAALMGGVAAQEVIKFLTHQWQPLNNTFIFNGIRSSANTIDV